MKVGVLGAGAMGGTVAGHLKECPEVTGIIAYDICEEHAARLGEQYDIEATVDLTHILADSEVPLVFVTASNDAHKTLVLQSLATGKAIMCEKPVATTLADAREMIEAAERHDAFLQIGFECRYSKLYMKVKEWIDAGLFGDVINTHCYYVSSEFIGRGSWRNTIANSGNMFGEKLSHYVDLPRWWIADEVKDVRSVCAPNVVPYYEIRDNYHTTYSFRNGAVSHLTFMMAPAATFQGDPLQNVINQQLGDGHALRYFIHGTKGAAATDVFARTIKRWEFGDSPKGMTSAWVEDLSWDAKEDHAYFHNTQQQTEDIVRRVMAGLGARTPARDSYETTKLCFGAELSADTGDVVDLADLDES